MIRQISGSNFLKFSPMISGGGANDFISLFTLLLHDFAKMWMKSVPCSPSKGVSLLTFQKEKKC